MATKQIVSDEQQAIYAANINFARLKPFVAPARLHLTCQVSGVVINAGETCYALPEQVSNGLVVCEAAYAKFGKGG